METAMVRQEVTISELWERIRTDGAKKASAAMGWDVDTVKKVLYRAIHGNYRTENDDWMRIEDEVRNNSLRLSSKTGPISVVHMFVKEFDGKIAHLMMAPDVVDDAFLFDDYASPRRYDRMGEVLNCVFFEAGNGLFHGIKVSAKKLSAFPGDEPAKEPRNGSHLDRRPQFQRHGRRCQDDGAGNQYWADQHTPERFRADNKLPWRQCSVRGALTIEQTQNFNNARYETRASRLSEARRPPRHGFQQPAKPGRCRQ